jgi:transposase-like protein
MDSVPLKADVHNITRELLREFEPQVLKKNQTSISQDIEEKILSMYAKGKLDT